MSRGLVIQSYNETVPYDFTVKFSNKIGQTWVDITSADDLYNSI